MDPDKAAPFAITMTETEVEDPFTQLHKVKVRLTADEFTLLMTKLPLLKQLQQAMR